MTIPQATSAKLDDKPMAVHPSAIRQNEMRAKHASLRKVLPSKYLFRFVEIIGIMIKDWTAFPPWIMVKKRVAEAVVT
jgi:hypothetical protein